MHHINAKYTAEPHETYSTSIDYAHLRRCFAGCSLRGSASALLKSGSANLGSKSASSPQHSQLRRRRSLSALLGSGMHFCASAHHADRLARAHARTRTHARTHTGTRTHAARYTRTHHAARHDIPVGWIAGCRRTFSSATTAALARGRSASSRLCQHASSAAAAAVKTFPPASAGGSARPPPPSRTLARTHTHTHARTRPGCMLR